MLEDDRLVPAGAVPDTANADMRKLLERGVTGGAPSIVGRVLGAPAPFGIRHAKIGFGTLGTSGNCISNPTKDCVLSETLTITRKKDGLAFAVVYQNVKDPANLLDIKRIRDILQKTIDAF